MDDVRGLFLGMLHGTTPAAVTTNENIIVSSFKSSGDIQKKEGGPDSCFGKSILFMQTFPSLTMSTSYEVGENHIRKFSSSLMFNLHISVTHVI